MAATDKLHRQLDETFEHFLDSIVIDVTEAELTPKLRAERRKLADHDDYEFCKIYFPSIFNEPFSDLHAHIKKLQKGFYSVSGCRFYGKSAFGYITKLVKNLCMGNIGLYGLILRDKEDSKKRTAALTRLIKRNKKLMYDYSVNFQRDTIGYYLINNCELIALGYREGLRNEFDEEFKRFKVLIADDLYNRMTVGTAEGNDNEKVYNFVTSECTGQLDPGGLFIWFFNYITPQSAGYKYAEEHPDTHFNYPALNDNGETNWPGHSLYTTEYLKQKSVELPYDVWMGDWMNDPIVKGEIFDVDWLRTFNINLIELSAVLTAVDPSIGSSPDSCFKGVCTMGITKDMSLCVLLDIYIRKESYDLMFDYIDRQRENYKNLYKAVLFENDFEQWFTAQPYYTKWTEKRKKYLPIIPYSAKVLKTDFYGSDKDSRIMNLCFPFQTGGIVINEAITGSKDYKTWKGQYISFGKNKSKLDGLDATATAFIMLPRYMSTGNFKSIKKRTGATKENSWLHGRS